MATREPHDAPKLVFFRGHSVELNGLMDISTSVMCLKRTFFQPVPIIKKRRLKGRKWKNFVQVLKYLETANQNCLAKRMV